MDYAIDTLQLLDEDEGSGKGNGKGNGKGKGGGHGSGAFDEKDYNIEPDVFDNIPMEVGAEDQDVTVGKGVVKNASPHPRALPTVGAARLQYDLQRLLRKTATEDNHERLRSGRLSRQWVRVATEKVDVFHRREEKAGIDSAVLIALDQSGSMAGVIERCAVSIGVIVAALTRTVGVKFSVRGFGSASSSGTVFGSKMGADGTVPQHEGLSFEVAGWRVFKDWNDSLGVFVGRFGSLNWCSGGTPDLAALTDAVTALAARPEPRKLLLWVGDGEGYNAAGAKALQKRYPNITIIAIGMDGSDLSRIFDNAVQVKDASELTRVGLSAVMDAVKREMR